MKEVKIYMKIAIVLEQELHDGGGFQYALSMIQLLHRHQKHPYTFIVLTSSLKNIEILKRKNISCQYFKFSFLHKIIFYIKLLLLRRYDSQWDQILSQADIDLIYFVSPSYLAEYTFSHNYIFTVWDLCHRDFPEFPEVNFYGQFEKREKLYHQALPKAIAVIADSTLGKENLVRRYQIDPERIIVFPFLPACQTQITKEFYKKNFISISEKYHIPGPYIFYPSQFWPHKNHIYILNALKFLKEKQKKTVYAVFCGAEHGNLNYILRQAEKLGIKEQIFYIGLAPDIEIPYLYSQALALVMPTYFGPTNIPPLEAWQLSCPVIYSDLPGLREQVQGAGLLIDLNNPEDLARNIQKILKKDPQIAEFVASGRNRVNQNKEEDYWQTLEIIFKNYSNKLQCWREGN